MDWTGRELVLTVDDVAHGGVFVGRYEGRVVFVRRALPGETVRVRVTEDRGKGFCRAETLDVVDPSPDRVADPCPAAATGGAGCCDYSHASIDAQRRLKVRVLAGQLGRIAHESRTVAVEAIPGYPGAAGWRTRVRLAVGPGGEAGYRRYRGNAVVPDLRCPQAATGLLDGVDGHRRRPGEELAVVLDDDDRRHIVAFAPPRLTPRAQRGTGRRGANARRAARSAPRAQRVVEGDGHAVQRVHGRTWDVSPTGFWQVHRGAAEAYASLAGEWSGVRGGELVWDLYGGAGVFAWELARRMDGRGRVEVVESSGRAVADGRAALADVDAVRFHHGRVANVLPTLRGDAPDVVVVDPPRSGAGREVVRGLADAGAGRIVHVGCDPAAFARDVSLYREHGFTLEALHAYDGFPMTHHVEAFALLSR